jgi:HK97 family phage major capsid protein
MEELQKLLGLVKTELAAIMEKITAGTASQDDAGKAEELISRKKRYEDQIAEYRVRNPKQDEVKEPGKIQEPKVEVGSKNYRKLSLGERFQAVAAAGMQRGAGKIGRFMSGEVAEELRLETREQEEKRAVLGMSEGVNSEGGFLVQNEKSDELLEKVYDESILYNLCEKQPITVGAGYEQDYVNETSRADGSRQGGTQVYWRAEGVANSPTIPKIGQLDLKLQDLIGYTAVTYDLLQDAAGLEAKLTRMFTNEFAFKIDNAIFRGTGAGQPLGIINSPSFVSVAGETGQVTGTVITKNILKMMRQLWPASKSKAVFLANCDLYDQLAELYIAAGTGGIPVWQPAGGLADKPNETLLGRPLHFIEQASAAGVPGTTASTLGTLVLADLSQYLIIEKGGMQGESSIHIAFDTAQTAFRWILRINGAPLWSSSLTPFKGTNKLSPFVGLAAI